MVVGLCRLAGQLRNKPIAIFVPLEGCRFDGRCVRAPQSLNPWGELVVPAAQCESVCDLGKSERIVNLTNQLLMEKAPSGQAWQ